MKRIFLFAAVLSVLIFSGCKKEEKTISFDTLKADIVTSVKLNGSTMTDFKGNESMAERYGIPIKSVKNGFAYSKDDEKRSADEIIVIEAVDEKSVSDIEKSLEAEITGLASTWEGTDDKEYAKVKDHILKSNGKYVLLAIGDESEAAEKIFEKHMKK